jgi:hypothetical protein
MIRRLLLVCSALLIFGCDNALAPDPPPPGPLPASCDEARGTEHAGFIQGAAVWRAADGPHRLVGSVQVTRLTIEAGALVCGSTGADIRLVPGGMLMAEGSAEAPIVFTAQDSVNPWNGLRLHGDTVTLSHVIVEHATRGAWTNPEGLSRSIGPVEIRNALFRVIHGPAIWVGYYSSVALVESVVDSACLGIADCAAISVVGRGPELRFEESVIRNSGGMGIYASTVGSGPAAHLTFVGGAIEQSAGIGLHTAGQFLSFHVVNPVQITGGGSYPARVHLPLAAALLATPTGHEGWLGNARDTVILHGAAARTDSATVRPGLVWSVQHFDGSIGRFALEPGASVLISGTLRVVQMLADGVPDDPVEIRGGGLRISGAEAAASRIAHTRLDGVALTTGTAGLVMDAVMADGGSVSLDGPGARLTNSRLRGAMLRIRAEDIEVATCTITGNDGAGILAEVAEGVRVRDCNLQGNVGPGLRNTAQTTLDARDNWWGDPAGPHGPAGDGVEGDVLFEPWKTEPVATFGVISPK